MRGRALSNPEAVEALAPFIVTYWNGSPDDVEPSEIEDLVRRSRIREQNNCYGFVLDADGELVRGFHIFQGRTPPPGDRLVEGFLEELRRTDVERPAREVSAPQLPDGDVLVYVRTGIGGGAPVVEGVLMTDADWAPLLRPQERVEIDAELLRAWISQVYPPAMMERGHSMTGIHGTLTLEPQGDHAILSGGVRLVMGEDDPDYPYTGTIEAVIRYDGEMPTLRGVFRGTYARLEPRDRRRVDVTIEAAIESRP